VSVYYVWGVVEVSVSYNKLWHLLLDKNMTKTELRLLTGVSTNVIAKMGRNESISMGTLEKICIALHCDIADIVEMPNGKT
jgi:DNA (cytosine-5)-methyltransferase 1